MDIDQIAFGDEAVIPYFLEQHGARQHLAGAPHHEFQQLELARQQIHLARAAMGGALDQIDPQRPHRQRGLARVGRAPQQRLDAGEQFAHHEGLAEIIVAAGLEALDTLIRRGEGRQHQHRQMEPLLLHAGDQGQAVQFGQGAVDDGEIGRLGPDRGQRVEAGSGMARLIPLGFETGEDLHRHVGIVLDHQDRGIGLHRGTREARRHLQSPYARYIGRGKASVQYGIAALQ